VTQLAFSDFNPGFELLQTLHILGRLHIRQLFEPMSCSTAMASRAVVVSILTGLMDMVICTGLAVCIYVRQKTVAYQMFVIYAARGALMIYTLISSKVSATLLALHLMFSIVLFMVVICLLSFSGLEVLVQVILLGYATFADFSVIILDGKQEVVLVPEVLVPEAVVASPVVTAAFKEEPDVLPIPPDTYIVQMPEGDNFAVAQKISG
jgi:hypothetical protein